MLLKATLHQGQRGPRNTGVKRVREKNAVKYIIKYDNQQPDSGSLHIFARHKVMLTSAG